VLYLGFYYLQGLERAADYADAKMATLCAEAPVSCFFIDPRYNATTGTGLQTPQMLGGDGIHPTPEGYKVLAQMIWDTALHQNITL
jgi:lysophospholipase L1-like esterase